MADPFEPRVDAAVILDELLAERGGRKAFNAVALAAARALALALVAPSPSPNSIAALTDLLPPAAPREKPLDLRLLDDNELDFFGYLVGRAQGEQPPKLTRETCTVRALFTRVLAGLLDRIGAERCYTDDDERAQVRNAVESVLDLVRCAPDRLWTEIYEAEFLQIRDPHLC
jgi:hypothetical protein